MKKLLLIILYFGFSLFVTAYDELIYLPKSQNQKIIYHTYYILSYSDEHKQALWVYYQIKTGNAKRTNNFRKDPKITMNSASTDDYLNSGYDRGHLAPAGSMTINKTAMNECFYMSNIAPQVPSFNRGKWRELEELVRKWSKTDNSLLIVVGTIFSQNPPKIGNNNVAVPKYFYKVIYSPKQQKMIAFLLENRKLTKKLKDFIVTVDLIENLSKTDLFSQLDDNLEMRLESILGEF